MENDFIIENILLQDEGVRLEFKQDLDLAAIGKVITGFVNTQGGDVLIGVGKNKELVGVKLDDGDILEIRDILLNSIKPLAPLSLQRVEYKGKTLLLISVWEGGKKPYHFENVIYTRNGSRTFVGTGSKLERLIQERRSSDFNWERQALLGAELNDLDLGEVRKTLESYNAYSQEEKLFDEESFLLRLGLMVNGNLTNASMVLFGKEPTRFIPQSRIRVTIYPGKEKGNAIIDDRIFEGNIFRNVKEILEYLDIIYGKEIKIEGILRKEKKKYSELAVREGLLNAIVHRDYQSTKGFLQVSVFQDRTIIANYGGLPKGLTVKDLKIEHSSILRNPDIAQVCFYRRLIEMLGSGTIRMIQESRKSGFKSPVWKDSNNILQVTFPGLTHQQSGEINEGVSEGVKFDIEGVSEGVKSELETLYRIIQSNPRKKANDLSEMLGKGLSTVERYLKILREYNLVENVGSPKTGGYKIVE